MKKFVAGACLVLLLGVTSAEETKKPSLKDLQAKLESQRQADKEERQKTMAILEELRDQLKEVRDRLAKLERGADRTDSGRRMMVLGGPVSAGREPAAEEARVVELTPAKSPEGQPFHQFELKLADDDAKGGGAGQPRRVRARVLRGDDAGDAEGHAQRFEVRVQAAPALGRSGLAEDGGKPDIKVFRDGKAIDLEDCAELGRCIDLGLAGGECDLGKLISGKLAGGDGEFEVKLLGGDGGDVHTLLQRLHGGRDGAKALRWVERLGDAHGHDILRLVHERLRGGGCCPMQRAECNHHGCCSRGGHAVHDKARNDCASACEKACEKACKGGKGNDCASACEKACEAACKGGDCADACEKACEAACPEGSGGKKGSGGSAGSSGSDGSGGSDGSAKSKKRGSGGSDGSAKSKKGGSGGSGGGGAKGNKGGRHGEISRGIDEMTKHLTELGIELEGVGGEVEDALEEMIEEIDSDDVRRVIEKVGDQIRVRVLRDHDHGGEQPRKKPRGERKERHQDHGWI